MSFPGSWIPRRLLRVLASGTTDGSFLQIVRANYRDKAASQSLTCYLRTPFATQFLRERSWVSFRTPESDSLLYQFPKYVSTEVENSEARDQHPMKAAKVVFVLGGPGSGKGTQCALIVEHFGFTHLSAGDLLRAEIKSGSQNGAMIQSMIKEGKIVPSEVTVKLLQKAMLSSDNDKFLIDGFPRNEENRSAFELITGIRPEFILFFECSEKEMEKRVLGRNEGRIDDNIETIKKRFKVFIDSGLPVLKHYDSLGKLRKINGDRMKEEVFESVRPLFTAFAKKD
ncbi:hypothetical protein KP509_10G044700 [Ceratopteris richardii]|uniref:UMP-CMP kinase n=1 Tax=Ceratopteris richardii TaxID=49495 RepID=A0A8T2U1H3_CERRI|nr:hypothetical protein KP509_10G044700 [Ceratopteris richardii]